MFKDFRWVARDSPELISVDSAQNEGWEQGRGIVRGIENIAAGYSRNILYFVAIFECSVLSRTF